MNTNTLKPEELYLRSVTFDKTADNTTYPYSVPVIQENSNLEFMKPVTIIVGENGIGKSTLIEAIALASGFSPEGGSKNMLVQTANTTSELHKHIKITKGIRRPKDGYFLRSESYFNVASAIEDLDKDPLGGPPVTSYYGGQSLHHMSHGESFMALLTNRLYGKGFYIFDEPEAALSPNRQIEMITRINELCSQQSQFIIASHSPIILGIPGAEIWHVQSSGKIKIEYYGNLDHVRVTEKFIKNKLTASE